MCTLMLLRSTGGTARGEAHARGRTCGCDRQDAIGVDVKFDLHLRHSAGRRRDAVQPEVAQGLVVPHELTLTYAAAAQM